MPATRGGESFFMEFKVINPSIPEVILVVPRLHVDFRGSFSETWSRRAFAAQGIQADFVQDNMVLSARQGTLRGLHFQVDPHPQGKLISVLRGSIFDVAVDIRHGSPSFGQNVSAVLSRDNWNQLWVPPGFAHGYCTLEPDTEVAYKVTDHYAPECERGIRWDDPALGIDWPVAGLELSITERDRQLPDLASAPVSFRY